MPSMDSTTVYVLRKTPRADDEAEGLMLPRRTSLLGRVNGQADFLPEDLGRRDSQPTRLVGVWQPVEVVGDAAPDDDYPSMSRQVGMYSERARIGLRDLLEPNGELLPLVTAGQPGRHWLYHLRTVADVLDEGRSTFVRYAGHAFACSAIKQYSFDPVRVGPLSIFKVPQVSDIHVTDRFVRRARELALNGFQFLKVWPLPPGTDWEQLAKQQLRASWGGPTLRTAPPANPGTPK